MSNPKTETNIFQNQKVQAMLLIFVLTIASGVAIKYGFTPPQQQEKFFDTLYDFAAELGMSTEQLNTTLRSMSYEFNPIFLSTSNTWNYTVHMLKDPAPATTIYYVVQKGDGTFMYSSTNMTHSERMAVGNMTTAGRVALVNFAHNYNITIPSGVSVWDWVNGSQRVYCNVADSQGSPYTISVDNRVAGYYMAQDSQLRYIANWTSTNAHTVVNSTIYAAGSNSIVKLVGNIILPSPLILTGLHNQTILFDTITATTTSNVFDIRGSSSNIRIEGNTVNVKDSYVSRVFLVYQANNININVGRVSTTTPTSAGSVIGFDQGQATYCTINIGLIENFYSGVNLGSACFGNTISINLLKNAVIAVKLLSTGSSIYDNKIKIGTTQAPTLYALYAGGTVGIFANTVDMGRITETAFTNAVLLNYSAASGNNHYSFICNANTKTALNVSGLALNDFLRDVLISDVTSGLAVSNSANLTCTNTYWDLAKVANTGIINYANHFDGGRSNTYTFVDVAGTYRNCTTPP